MKRRESQQTRDGRAHQDGAPTRELQVAHTTLRNELRKRVPWMGLALVAGGFMVFVSRHFEQALSRNLELVLFVPVIVYLSDSIGTETLALFVRELSQEKVVLRKLLLREVMVGLTLGIVTGVPVGLLSYLWLKDARLGVALLLAMTVNGLVAVLTGMLVPMAFAKLRRDPALGTDEITTAISDNASLLIYLVVATLILAS